jgi:hypothetical protein
MTTVRTFPQYLLKILLNIFLHSLLKSSRWRLPANFPAFLVIFLTVTRIYSPVRHALNKSQTGSYRRSIDIYVYFPTRVLILYCAFQFASCFHGVEKKKRPIFLDLLYSFRHSQRVPVTTSLNHVHFYIRCVWISVAALLSFYGSLAVLSRIFFS